MPQEKLITYKWSSVLFNLFFDYKLINKYPKEVFLPWESKKSTETKRVSIVSFWDFIHK